MGLAQATCDCWQNSSICGLGIILKPVMAYTNDHTMKKMMQQLSLLVLGIMLSTLAMAQSGSGYRTAIGLRGGFTSGLTVKQFVSGRDAVEGIFSAWPYDVSITGLYERHVPAGRAPGLNFYYGGGAHLRFFTFYNSEYYFYKGRYYVVYGADGRGGGIGIDGVLGLEYKIPAAPIAFSLDFKPFVEFGAGGYFLLVPDAGLGIKVAF